jgi:hypothetical protein
MGRRSVTSGRTVWRAKDAAWWRRERVVELGQEFGAAGPAVLDWLEGEAKAQNDGGRVKTGFRALAHGVFTSHDEARAIVARAIEIGALDDFEEQGRGFIVRVSGFTHDQTLGRDAMKKAATRATGPEGTTGDTPRPDPDEEGQAGTTGGPTREDRREVKEEPVGSSSSEVDQNDDERVDVNELCTLLADRVEQNTGRRPNVTKSWRREARLLLDRDGRTVDQVRAVIDWCQADSFWRSNVLGMPKLRDKFDQLTLRMKAAGVTAAIDHPAPRPLSREEHFAHRIRQRARQLGIPEAEARVELEAEAARAAA